MIPIVYDKNDTQRTTNGLGRLIDCIECTVSNSANDHSCELHIIYPTTGRHSELLTYSNIIGVQTEPHGNVQLFDVYRISENETGNIEVDAHHVRHRLKYLPTAYVHGETIAEIVRSLNMVYVGAKKTSFGSGEEAGTTNFGYHLPFVFWTNITQDSLFYQIQYSNVTAEGNYKSGYYYAMGVSEEFSTSFWDVLFGKDGLVEVFGLAVKFDNFNVYIAEPNSLSNDKTSDITLRYGKDILSFTTVIDTGDYEIYTHAIPYKIRKVTSGESEHEYCNLYMEDSSVQTSFPIVVEVPDLPIEVAYRNYVGVDVSATDVGRVNFPTVDVGYASTRVTRERLESVTKKIAKKMNSAKISPSLELNMTDLRNEYLYKQYKGVEHVYLGDVVSVAIEELDTKVAEEIIDVEYNVLLEQYNLVGIGAIQATVADVLIALNEEKENESSNKLLSHSSSLSQYTIETELSGYESSDLVVALYYDYSSDGSNVRVTSEPLRAVGTLITGNLSLNLTQKPTNTPCSIPSGTYRKILEGLPVPCNGEVEFTFPTYLIAQYDTDHSSSGGNRTIDIDYKIDSNGDLYMNPHEDMNIDVGNWATQYRAIKANFQYFTAAGNYDHSWKNYIISTDSNWKERESA